jgi:hypothetical protein
MHPDFAGCIGFGLLDGIYNLQFVFRCNGVFHVVAGYRLKVEKVKS